MSKIIFNEFEIQRLQKNPHIKHVSDRSIAYHPDFIAAVKENLTGKGPIVFCVVSDLNKYWYISSKYKSMLVTPLR